MNNRLKRNSIPIQSKFYYGWVIVIISGMGIFFSGPGQTFSNSVFIESYTKHLDLSHTTVSSIYSVATLLSGLLLFLIGRLVDQVGRRVMMTVAVLFLGIACFFNSIVAGPIMLFIGFFMVRYFGQGSLMLIPNTLVSQWFFKYRGRALSFASLGGLAGAACFPPVINWLVEDYGWQSAWRILGAILILFFMPICYFFVRNRPEDVGLLPDGADTDVNMNNGNKLILEDSWSLGEAIRTKSFWFIMICGAIPAMIYTGITFHIFSILGERGIDRMTVAFVLSLIPITSFVCSLFAGFIVERVKANRMLSLTFVVSIFFPIILIFADSYAAIILFAIVWGVTQGFMNIPMGVIWPNYFGRQYLGSIQSITHAAVVLGSALGPFLFGWSYDRFGDYVNILIISAFIWGIGAILSFVATPPRRIPAKMTN